MSPTTSPNDQSPVKPPCHIEFIKTIEDSDSDINSAEYIVRDAVFLTDDINAELVLDKLYRPEFMEMDGTYDHNNEIPLTFSYGVEPKSICNVNKHKGKVQRLKPMHLIVFRTC